MQVIPQGLMLMMLPLVCKGLAGINSLLLMYISILHDLMHMLTVKPLRCTNTLWLGVYPSRILQSTVWLQWDRSTNIWLGYLIKDRIFDQGYPGDPCDLEKK